MDDSNKIFGKKNTLILHTVTIMSFMAAASAPTPLYQIYQKMWHFSPVILTLIFSTYAFLLLISLLIGGSLSDFLGRRPVIVFSILLQLLSMLFFLLADKVVMLFIARGIQGIATALAVSALGAALLDLSKEKGALINSIAPMLGMTIGAFLSCLVLQYSNIPLKHVFLILIMIYIIELFLTAFSLESSLKKVVILATFKPKITIPIKAKRTLITISPINIALWMLSGFFLSLMPSLLNHSFHINSAWLNGLSFTVMAISGAIGILFLRNYQASFILRLGTISLILGTLVLIISINITNISFLLLGSLIAGLGFGASFMGALRAVMPLAPVDERAGLMATFYIISYLAFSLPTILIGLLINQIGLVTSSNIFLGSIILLGVIQLILIFKLSKKANF